MRSLIIFFTLAKDQTRHGWPERTAHGCQGCLPVCADSWLLCFALLSLTEIEAEQKKFAQVLAGACRHCQTLLHWKQSRLLSQQPQSPQLGAAGGTQNRMPSARTWQ